DASFVRTLFDENPHRGSFHSFLLDDRGEPAGHYAVIPMDIVVAGERKRAGKGEAFVVRADARRESVAFAGMRPILAGPALQFHLFRHALERGLEVVHMIASGDVALVHRMSGAHPLPTRHRRSGLVLRPAQLAESPRSPWRRALRGVLGAGQRTASSW